MPAEEVEEVSVRMCAVNLASCNTYKNHMMLNVRLIFSIMVLFTRRNGRGLDWRCRVTGTILYFSVLIG